MPSSGRSARSSPGSSGRSSAGRTSSPGQKGPASGRASPPSGRGPGFTPLLLAFLLLGGIVVLLVRSGALSTGGMFPAPDDTPACPRAVNAWADQRLKTLRDQLIEDHGLYRGNGEALNAIGAAMNWIDDRIIDQRIGEERQRILSNVLNTLRCLVQFEP